MKKQNNRLLELKNSDFEIVKGYPDIRSWSVKNAGGKKIGTVDDLVIDVERRKVRYMVVDASKNDLCIERSKVLIPIGLAELHRNDDDVILPHVQKEQLNNLPEYNFKNMDSSMERKICYSLGRSNVHDEKFEMMDPDPEFYKHDYYKDDNLYRHRLKEKSERMKDSDYESGLRLWEKRSEGGIIPGTAKSHSGTPEQQPRRSEKKTAQNEMMAVKGNRGRTSSRSNNNHRYGRPGKTIEDRIRREGLRDAGDPS